MNTMDLADPEYRWEAAVRKAITVERARIARELHDVVAHAVTVMLLHAAGARQLLVSAPVQAMQALGRIDEQGRQAMQELRRMLQLLRSEADLLDEPAGRRQPDAGDIKELVEVVGHAGVPVQLQVDGEPRPLPPGVGLTAYRVVQEGLTNASKHAGPDAAVTVRLAWAGDLRIEVTNVRRLGGERRSRRLSAGHGLLGLQERVSLAGGRMKAGPTAEGGFKLTATLPLTTGDQPGAGDRPGAEGRGR
jgi:signal transduction histidine kinase